MLPRMRNLLSYLTTYQKLHIRQFGFTTVKHPSTSCRNCTPAVEISTNKQEIVCNDPYHYNNNIINQYLNIITAVAQAQDLIISEGVVQQIMIFPKLHNSIYMDEKISFCRNTFSRRNPFWGGRRVKSPLTHHACMRHCSVMYIVPIV